MNRSDGAKAGVVLMLCGVALVAAGGCTSSERGTPRATPVSGSGPSSGAGVHASGGAGGAGGGQAEGGAGGASLLPPSGFVPTPSAPCPSFANGSVTFAFGNSSSRNVVLRVSAAAAAVEGPLVVVWHATGQGAVGGLGILGQAVVDQIVAEGGVVAAPEADAGAGLLSWYLADGGVDSEDDLLLLDQIVACAESELDIDTGRIHLVGHAEGAMQTVQAAARRSGYVASIAAHSTSLQGTPGEQDPTNRYAAMVLHGGPGDTNGDYAFNLDSATYASLLSDAGSTQPFAAPHFTVLCEHGGGFVLAADAQAAVWRFLSDHRYGSEPSPYVSSGLPSVFPLYCSVL
jgi:predicted esterase